MAQVSATTNSGAVAYERRGVTALGATRRLPVGTAGFVVAGEAPGRRAAQVVPGGIQRNPERLAMLFSVHDATGNLPTRRQSWKGGASPGSRSRGTRVWLDG